MLSAHGSAPEVVEAARAEDRYVVNAVCPLVTKVHHEAKVRARKGFTVLYVGHAGHDEAVGTLAVAPDAIRLVERAADLDARPRRPSATRPQVAMLAQTTLAHGEWTGVLDDARSAPATCGPRRATTSASRRRTVRTRSPRSPSAPTRWS
jgi:4-hydroxy-3-methylbut-2-enyl diphosphate reductase